MDERHKKEILTPGLGIGRSTGSVKCTIGANLIEVQPIKNLSAMDLPPEGGLKCQEIWDRYR